MKAQHEKDIQECLAIENGKAALSCLKKVVKEYPETAVCRPKLVLLVQDGCTYCKDEAKIHEDDIAGGIVKRINIKSSEGSAIVKQNNIEYVPSLLLLDCHGKIIDPV